MKTKKKAFKRKRLNYYQESYVREHCNSQPLQTIAKDLDINHSWLRQQTIELGIVIEYEPKYMKKEPNVSGLFEHEDSYWSHFNLY
jgi:hypothetical protein